MHDVFDCPLYASDWSLNLAVGLPLSDSATLLVRSARSKTVRPFANVFRASGRSWTAGGPLDRADEVLPPKIFLQNEQTAWSKVRERENENSRSQPTESGQARPPENTFLQNEQPRADKRGGRTEVPDRAQNMILQNEHGRSFMRAGKDRAKKQFL